MKRPIRPYFPPIDYYSCCDCIDDAGDDDDDRFLPFQSYGDESEDAGSYGAWNDEGDELAIQVTEWPMTSGHVDEVEHRVEDRYQGVGRCQVDQEVVGHGPHALVGEYDPNDDGVATDGHQNHGKEEQSVHHLQVQSQLERVFFADISWAGRVEVFDEFILSR